MKSLVLFNNKGGVGKTTLTFNIAHMLARLGYRTVTLDYDPQCILSAICLSEDDLIDLWESNEQDSTTVARCIDLVRRGKEVLKTPRKRWPIAVDDDEYCIALLKHFASLVPIAQQARKPIFDLKQADGVGGGQIQAVARARVEFTELARAIALILGI